jgi:hypothetical protein
VSGHEFTRPGQVAPGRPAPDACMQCGQPVAEHAPAAAAAGLEQAREILGLDDRRRMQIRTEVQVESAGRILGRAREYLAKPSNYEDAWPARVGSLEYFTRALADELERVLAREQEWIAAVAAVAAGQPI